MRKITSAFLSSTLALTAASLMPSAIAQDVGSNKGAAASGGATTAGQAQNVPMGPTKAGPNAAVTGSPNTAGNSGSPAQMAGTSVTPAPSASGMMGKGAANLSRADRSFMTKAAEAGFAEVEAGKIAQSNGGHADVKKFGEHMTKDHGKANDELKQIAASKAVTLPDAPDRSHQRMAKQLRNLNGEKFDRVYAREAGVKDHKSAVALFTREAQKGSDPDVKGFAQKTLLTLQEHLKMAQSMHDSVIPNK